MEKLFISYAGAIGCGKSPITNYISTKLGLPTFNTDSIRSEVCEDLGFFDENEFKNRVNIRLESIIDGGISFIYDASIDRKRDILKGTLIKNNYKYFIISIDLDKENLLNFYNSKSYTESIKMIDRIYSNHQKFLESYPGDINLHINSENYFGRLNIVYNEIFDRIKNFNIK